jgi:hypothetical protein
MVSALLRVHQSAACVDLEEFDAVRHWFGSEPAEWQEFDVGVPGGKRDTRNSRRLHLGDLHAVHTRIYLHLSPHRTSAG